MDRVGWWGTGEGAVGGSGGEDDEVLGWVEGEVEEGSEVEVDGRVGVRGCV